MTTITDIVDGMTTAELRAFAAHALEHHPELTHYAMTLASGQAELPLDAPAPALPVRHIHIVRSLTDEQREVIRREYVPRGRGKTTRHVQGPSIQQLAKRFGVSYGAVRRAVTA